MGALLVGVEVVVCLISRCKVYELLYLCDHQATQSEVNLESALIKLYITILNFLVMAKDLYKSSGNRIRHGIFNPEKVKDFTDNCRTLEQQVEFEASNCERTHSRTIRTEWGKDRKILKQILVELESVEEPIMRTDVRVAALFNSLNERDCYEMLTWVSDIPHEDMHYTARQGRTDGTGEWLLGHEKLRVWQKSNTSTILWLHGIRKSLSQQSGFDIR